jgi:hypothetical protein
MVSGLSDPGSSTSTAVLCRRSIRPGHPKNSVFENSGGRISLSLSRETRICSGSRIWSQIWRDQYLGTRVRSSSMWFFEVAILEITKRFFKFVWKILSIQPTILVHTQEKKITPPFSRRWELFPKIGLHGCNSIAIPLTSITTMEADFWKKFSSSRKRGGADAF